jgi:hypothetical protein
MEESLVGRRGLEPSTSTFIDWDESVHIKSTYTAAVLVGGILPSTPIPPSPWWMWVLLGIFLLVAFLVSRARRRR